MDAITGAPSFFWRRIGHVVAHEILHALPATLFFAIGFNLIVLSLNFVLARYYIHFAGFMLVTAGALIVGKVVLVADKLPFLRRFDTAPLFRPILFKTSVYWALVFIARLIEAFIDYLIKFGTPIGFFKFLADDFSWDRFVFTQLWILVLFLAYTLASELNALFGDGELRKVLFTRRSTESKLTRRQRIRALVRLSRLTDAYSLDQLTDTNNPAHDQLVAVIITLTADREKRAAS